MTIDMATTVADKLEADFRKQPRGERIFQHWQEQRDEADVAWLFFDRQDSNTNTLNAEVLKELDQILDNLDDKPPRAVVIRSLKSNGFCLGADIRQFSQFKADEAVELLRQGHRILDRLEQLRMPTVAVVHGHCLGGGLELALACDRRLGVAGINSSLQMGFPEIQLGLHPGLGGSFRLLNLISPITAMTMMLTGSPAHGGQCLQRGLVDEMVEERHIERAIHAGLQQRKGRSKQGLVRRLLNSAPARKLAAGRMRAEAARKAPPQHYPAPNALIDLWLQHGGDRRTMQEAEIQSFARLLDSATSKNLVRVFFLRQALKDQASKDQVSKDQAGNNSQIERVHVIGAGAMGGDIAGWCALQGCHVTLSDMKLEPIAQAVKNAEKLCRRRYKSAIETRAVLDRLIPDPRGLGLAQADLVIEAAPESLEIKTRIYQDIEPRMRRDAILATNTSSIPLEKLAGSLNNPERLLGIHFFNPVAQMMIVEVVSHDQAAPDLVTRAIDFTAAIGKLPVAVRSYPGFLVNRALTPYLMEAIVLFDEGVDKERIDRAAVAFGMPMGPLELADQVGLDICLHVAEVLRNALEKPMPAVPEWLQKKVDKGDVGRKSGHGFYEWKNGKVVRKKGSENGGEKGADSLSGTDQELRDRLILPMLNACVECYREGVISDLDQLDAAMIFATGFAPFSGGPIHYAHTRGVDKVTARLEELAVQHGERFAPDSGWSDIKA